MAKSKEPIHPTEFEPLRTKLFAGANAQVAAFGRRLMQFSWQKERFATLQQWEGKDDRLIVFGVPEEKRVRRNAK